MLMYAWNRIKNILASKEKLQSWKHKQSWTRRRKFVCICLIFMHYYRKFIFGGETGYSTVFPRILKFSQYLRIS